MPHASATNAVRPTTNALRASTRRNPPKASTVPRERTSAPSQRASPAMMANASKLSRSNGARSRIGQQTRPVSKGTSTRSVRSMARSFRSDSFLRWFRCLLALPHRQSALVAWPTDEVRRPFRARRPETKLHSISFQFIDPELHLPLGRSVGHPVINGLGLLGRVDGEFRFHDELSSDRHGGLVFFADTLGGLPHGVWHGMTVSGPGHHGPFALQLGHIFLDRLIASSSRHARR